jgi:hypothetical protein
VREFLLVEERRELGEARFERREVGGGHAGRWYPRLRSRHPLRDAGAMVC